MEVLCLIPARGGSKGVPKKNLSLIGGETLIQHAAQCVAMSDAITRTVVSTNSSEIADHSRTAGLEVPFTRPEELAKDETTDLPVFEHCLKWLDENEDYRPEVVVHLRVTSPFAFRLEGDRWIPVSRSQVIDEAVRMLASDETLDAVRTVEEVRDTPYKMWNIEDGRLKPFVKSDVKEIYNQPRQKIPPVYLQNGFVDVSRRKTIVDLNMMYGNTIGAYLLECDHLVDIDTPADVLLGNIVFRASAEAS